MSLYSVSYTKMMNGYNKIYNCITSVCVIDQLECVSNLVDNWINLIDNYCDRIYIDKSNKNREKDANQLAEACKGMIETLKELYQQKLQELTPVEYEGSFQPVRIKSLPEMVHEQNEYDEDDEVNEYTEDDEINECDNDE